MSSRKRLNLKKVASVSPLTPESRDVLRRLASYHSSSPNERFPRSRRAAVLIALFIGRFGDIYVLLSQRAASLRSFAGDTSLPGGKMDPEDKTIEDTARREAFEEIGLPQDKARVPLLCTLDPFLSGNRLIVTPVVVLITDNAIQPVLNAPEVDSLFSHPLSAFLTNTAPFPLHLPPSTSSSSPPPPSSTSPSDKKLQEQSQLVTSWGTEYHTYADMQWGESRVRSHRFLTGREGVGIKPVFGLTSEIMIEAATVAYGRPPAFDVRAPEQKTRHERIDYAMRHIDVLRDACTKEGIDWDKEEKRYQAEAAKRRKEAERKDKEKAKVEKEMQRNKRVGMVAAEYKSRL